MAVFSDEPGSASSSGPSLPVLEENLLVERSFFRLDVLATKP